MLDEKCFYSTNKRRKVKKPPLGKDKKEGNDKVKHPETRSRRFSIKSTLMGLVERPRLDNIFDDMISLERVNKTHVESDDIIINSEIKADRWKDLCIPESNIQSDDLTKKIG